MLFYNVIHEAPDIALHQPSERGPLLVFMFLDPEPDLAVILGAVHPDVLHLVALLVRDPELTLIIHPQEISSTGLITQQLHGFLKISPV